MLLFQTRWTEDSAESGSNSDTSDLDYRPLIRWVEQVTPPSTGSTGTSDVDPRPQTRWIEPPGSGLILLELPIYHVVTNGEGDLTITDAALVEVEAFFVEDGTEDVVLSTEEGNLMLDVLEDDLFLRDLVGTPDFHVRYVDGNIIIMDIDPMEAFFVVDGDHIVLSDVEGSLRFTRSENDLVLLE